MPSKTWGKPQVIKDYVVVGEAEEILSGEKAYVFNKQAAEMVEIVKYEWEPLITGDLTNLKDKIETDVFNTKVLWLKVAWDSAVFQPKSGTTPAHYHVKGFYVEAIVENIGGASLTGAEIVLIIMAVSWLAVIVTLCLTGGWIAWRVIESTPQALVPVVGIGILAMIFFVIVLLFGVGFKWGKFKIGR